jgi:hypothetical protein
MFVDLFVVRADRRVNPGTTDADAAKQLAIDSAVSPGLVDYVRSPERVDALPPELSPHSVYVVGDVHLLHESRTEDIDASFWKLSAHVKPGDDLYPPAGEIRPDVDHDSDDPDI